MRCGYNCDMCQVCAGEKKAGNGAVYRLKKGMCTPAATAAAASLGIP